MHRILALFAITFGIVLALAIIVELAFGTWFAAEAPEQAGLGRSSVSVVTAAGLYPGGRDFTYRRDSWGFRGDGLDPAKIAILTLGGASTDQRRLPDDQTWQAVMEREFAAGGHESLVANAGLDGQTIADQLTAFTDWFPNVPGLRPRFVVFFVGLDEIPMTAPAAEAESPSIPRPSLLRHSALLRLADRLTDAAPAPEQPLTVQLPDSTQTTPEWRPDRATITAYAERLGQLAQLSHAMGAVPVFVVQGITAADNRHSKPLDEFNRATRDVCKDEGLLCLDLAREVNFTPADFYDNLHISPQGAEKVGRWLAIKLAGLV